MKRRTYCYLCILLVIAAGEAYSQRSSAAQLVRELYTAHDTGNGPFSQPPARARIDIFFTRRLGDLLWKDANNKTGEVGALDGDPLYNAQDMDIRSFTIGKAAINGRNATVPVTFTNFKRTERLVFVLKHVATDWKIDDIEYSASDSLYKWLKQTYPENSYYQGLRKKIDDVGRTVEKDTRAQPRRRGRTRRGDARTAKAELPCF